MSRLLVSVASVLLALGLWEMAGAAEWIDLRFFPRPTEIVRQCYEHLVYGELLFDLRISLWRVTMGTLIAVPLALVFALAMELNWFVGAVARPWVSFLYPMPKLAVFPLFLVLLGLGEPPKVALVALGVFFLVQLSASQGLRRILRSEFYDVALVYRVSLWNRLVHVLLRGAMPEIVNGIKLGLGYAFVMVIAAEFTATQRGIGAFVWNAWDGFRILDLYSGLLLIGVVGWVIFWLANHAERLFSHYD